MKHRFAEEFWTLYVKLPLRIQRRVTRCADMLRENPPRPSLHLKRLKTPWADWSARVDVHYRMAGKDAPDGGIIWFWAGHHHEYDKLSRRR